MKQNVTLSLDKDLIKKAKILAAQKDTSITGLLSEYFKKAVTQEETYQAAKQKALQQLEKGYSFGGKKIPRRDILHER